MYPLSVIYLLRTKNTAQPVISFFLLFPFTQGDFEMEDSFNLITPKIIFDDHLLQRN
ncbi:hypothetical protein BN1088_1430664 [Sphingobacterium sp. PM2-P1-29]|nr:hypothetical protein BN1088_1430664 [Sphingobacterium sp. PM2-P1-29]